MLNSQNPNFKEMIQLDETRNMTDNISIETCDLGLGNGLKPGALYINNSATKPYPDTSSHNNSKNTESDAVWNFHDSDHVSLQKIIPLSSVPIDHAEKDSVYLYQLYFGSTGGITSNQSTANVDDETLSSRFLNSCDTESILFHLRDHCSLGSSIHQQKTLFLHDLKSLVLERTCDKAIYDKLRSEDVPSTERRIITKESAQVGNITEKDKKKHKEDIEQELIKAQEELAILSNDFEVCHSKLTAKCKAIEIIRAQACETETQCSFKSQQNSQYQQKLEKEVNSLQFSLEYQQSSFMDSQQTWSQRFDRLCQDNAAMQKSLADKNAELMLALREKNAACLERDELFALLDVIDRQQYDRATPSFSGHNCESGCDINNCTYSVTQLAVLGACLCRGKVMEPCRCAHVAARLKAEVLHLKEQMDVCMGNQRDLECTIDAYRMAFDEQLSQNRILLRRLAEVCVLGSAVTSPKLDRAKAALKNLLQVVSKTDDLSHTVHSKPSTDISSKQSASKMSACFDDSFIDMVSDRLELLAQQKVAARILALKNQQLTQDEFTRVRGCEEEAFEMLQSDDLT